jgi:hypothetical protein
MSAARATGETTKRTTTKISGERAKRLGLTRRFARTIRSFRDDLVLGRDFLPLSELFLDARGKRGPADRFGTAPSGSSTGASSGDATMAPGVSEQRTSNGPRTPTSTLPSTTLMAV